MSQTAVQNPVTPSKDAAESSPKSSPSNRGDKPKSGGGEIAVLIGRTQMTLGLGVAKTVKKQAVKGSQASEFKKAAKVPCYH